MNPGGTGSDSIDNSPGSTSAGPCRDRSEASVRCSVVFTSARARWNARVDSAPWFWLVRSRWSPSRQPPAATPAKMSDDPGLEIAAMAAGFLDQHGQQEAPRIIARAIPLGIVRDSEDRVLEQPGCVRQSAEAIEPPRREGRGQLSQCPAREWLGSVSNRSLLARTNTAM